MSGVDPRVEALRQIEQHANASLPYRPSHGEALKNVREMARIALAADAVSGGEDRPTCTTADHERVPAVRYVTCEGEGIYPYCEECATTLLSSGETDGGRVPVSGVGEDRGSGLPIDAMVGMDDTALIAYRRLEVERDRLKEAAERAQDAYMRSGPSGLPFVHAMRDLSAALAGSVSDKDQEPDTWTCPRDQVAVPLTWSKCQLCGYPRSVSDKPCDVCGGETWDTARVVKRCANCHTMFTRPVSDKDRPRSNPLKWPDWPSVSDNPKDQTPEDMG